jgi:hypothetical protein
MLRVAASRRRWRCLTAACRVRCGLASRRGRGAQGTDRPRADRAAQ